MDQRASGGEERGRESGNAGSGGEREDTRQQSKTGSVQLTGGGGEKATGLTSSSCGAAASVDKKPVNNNNTIMTKLTTGAVATRAARAETRAARSETPRHAKKADSVQDDAAPGTRAEDDDDEEDGDGVLNDEEEHHARGRRTGAEDAATTADVEEPDAVVGEAASRRAQNGNSGGDASLSCNPDEADAVEHDGEKTKKRKKTSPAITSEGETLPSAALCNSDAGEAAEEDAGEQKRRRVNEKAGSPDGSSPANNGSPAEADTSVKCDAAGETVNGTSGSVLHAPVAGVVQETHGEATPTHKALTPGDSVMMDAEALQNGGGSGGDASRDASPGGGEHEVGSLPLPAQTEAAGDTTAIEKLQRTELQDTTGLVEETIAPLSRGEDVSGAPATAAVAGVEGVQDTGKRVDVNVDRPPLPLTHGRMRSTESSSAASRGGDANGQQHDTRTSFRGFNLNPLEEVRKRKLASRAGTRSLASSSSQRRAAVMRSDQKLPISPSAYGGIGLPGMKPVVTGHNGSNHGNAANGTDGMHGVAGSAKVPHAALDVSGDGGVTIQEKTQAVRDASRTTTTTTTTSGDLTPAFVDGTYACIGYENTLLRDQEAKRRKLSCPDSRFEPGKYLINLMQENDASGMDVSFCLNLYEEGFSLDMSASNPVHATGPSYPYDRTVYPFLRAINGGWVPGSLLSLLPCKYKDGCMLVEVRDFRHSSNRSTASTARQSQLPPAHRYRLLLRSSAESRVSHIEDLSKGEWSDESKLCAESLLLHATKPVVCLDPNPRVADAAARVAFRRSCRNISMSLRRVVALQPIPTVGVGALDSGVAGGANHSQGADTRMRAGSLVRGDSGSQPSGSTHSALPFMVGTAKGKGKNRGKDNVYSHLEFYDMCGMMVPGGHPALVVYDPEKQRAGSTEALEKIAELESRAKERKKFPVVPPPTNPPPTPKMAFASPREIALRDERFQHNNMYRELRILASRDLAPPAADRAAAAAATTTSKDATGAEKASVGAVTAADANGGKSNAEKSAQAKTSAAAAAAAASSSQDPKKKNKDGEPTAAAPLPWSHAGSTPCHLSFLGWCAEGDASQVWSKSEDDALTLATLRVEIVGTPDDEPYWNKINSSTGDMSGGDGGDERTLLRQLDSTIIRGDDCLRMPLIPSIEAAERLGQEFVRQLHKEGHVKIEAAWHRPTHSKSSPSKLESQPPSSSTMK